jgi:hypothetical protein
MMASQAREMEGAEDIPYEEGRVVRNWAGTFEARTERFYRPKTEEEVVKVRSLGRFI